MQRRYRSHYGEPEPPCKPDCPNRDADCHSDGSCEAWEIWQADINARRAEYQKQWELKQAIKEYDDEKDLRISKKIRRLKNI